MSELHRKTGDNSWVITVQENNKTKELYLELPPDAINQAGWDEGDTIVWEELDSGAWQLTKKESDET